MRVSDPSLRKSAVVQVSRLTLLDEHQAALRACRRCADMVPPPVVGAPVLSKLLLVGQAPGDKEPVLGRPFAWTAGKQLFKWFATLGVDEHCSEARLSGRNRGAR